MFRANLPPGPRDEERDQQAANRVEDRIPKSHRDETHNHRARGQDVAARRERVGEEQLAAQPPGLTAFVLHDQEIDDERAEHHGETQGADRRRRAAVETVDRRAGHLDHDEEQEHEDPGRGKRLVLPMAIRMVLVGRLPGRTKADDAHHVRGRVRQRMEAVGDDADRTGGVPEHQLRDRDRQVEDENADEDAVNRAVTGWQGRPCSFRVLRVLKVLEVLRRVPGSTL